VSESVARGGGGGVEGGVAVARQLSHYLK